MCVSGREKKRERDREKLVCVCERQRERESDSGLLSLVTSQESARLTFTPGAV